MEKYIIVSPGRSASNSLLNHISFSCSKRNLASHVLNLEMPILWPETEETPEEWTAVICYRRDMLAQVLSFYTVMLAKQSHKYKNIDIDPFTIPRTYFFTFSYGILFFHEKIFSVKEWPQFKNIHWFIYEDIINDWHGTGLQLGFDDWSSSSEGHAKGYGSVWDRVINKQQVLDWVKELQINHNFTIAQEKYKI